MRSEIWSAGTLTLECEKIFTQERGKNAKALRNVRPSLSVCTKRKGGHHYPRM